MAGEKFLDAVTNVTRAAVSAETYDKYQITQFHFVRNNPNGGGQIVVELCPKRAIDANTDELLPSGAVKFALPDPISDAAANPNGETALLLDAMTDFVAAQQSALVNAATP
jgi:hypothetical protein